MVSINYKLNLYSIVCVLVMFYKNKVPPILILEVQTNLIEIIFKFFNFEFGNYYKVGSIRIIKNILNAHSYLIKFTLNIMIVLA